MCVPTFLPFFVCPPFDPTLLCNVLYICMDDDKKDNRGGYRPPLKSHWPRPPKNFSRIELEAWVSICTDLEAVGTLETTDAKIIAIYCEDFGFKERLRTEIHQADELTDGVHRCPLIEPYQKQLAKLQRVLNDLGLTPSARKAKAKQTSMAADNPYLKMMTEGV